MFSVNFTPWIFAIGVIVSLASGFNLDVKNPLIGVGETGSYFGYSVAVHENKNTKWLLVGAPKGKQPNQTNPNSGLSGALYECSKNKNNLNCKNLTNSFSSETVGKDQWYGATVVSRNGTAMVCAPRYGEFVTGECYYSRGSLSSFTRYRPSTTPYSEVGFSAALSSDGNRFYTAGPSVDDNKGCVITSLGPDENKTDKYVNEIDLYFFGYAMAQGKVFQQREGLVVSIGFHYGSNFAGKVVILNSIDKPAVVESLIGQQAGEQFGASLAVIDLNNDGRDDIIVGAPHHCDYSSPEIRFDIGAVYIFYQNNKGTYDLSSTSQLILKGRSTGGEFGFSVAGLGDSDMDGSNDLVVGAPYENDGSGTVYIYHGSSKGLRNWPDQVIEGSSFYPAIRTLGFSFSSVATDLDGNSYSDLIIGAYQSDSVVLLPARPVVRITSNIQFQPAFILFDSKTCTAKLASGTSESQEVQVPCTTMKYCLTYDGFRVPTNIDTTITLTLDAKLSKSQRLLFLTTNQYKLTKIIKLSYKDQVCQEEVVYIKPDYRVKISAMEVTLNASIGASVGPLSPILDIYDGNGFATNSLSVYRNCGQDNICTPDLQLTTEMSSNTYVQGLNQSLSLDVAIFNAGEETHGVQFFLSMPSVLKYANMDRDHTDPSVSCSPPGNVNGPYLICDIGTALQTDKTARIRIIINPSPKNDQTVTLLAETNSTDTEKYETMADNKNVLNLTFVAETSLVLNSYHRPEALVVNMTALQLNGPNALPLYTQFYTVLNVGPSNILGARLRITFPLRTTDGNIINQLIGKPDVNEGPASCSPLQNDTSKATEIVIECDIQKMLPNNRAVVALKVQLFPEAFLKEPSDEFKILSFMSANITKLPFNQDVSSIPSNKASVTTIVTKSAQDLNVLQAVPLWIPIVSAIAGVLIVCGATYLLHHYGFFKRRGLKEMTAELNAVQESEPLQDLANTNHNASG